jgi:hypothetical protein
MKYLTKIKKAGFEKNKDFLLAEKRESMPEF